MTPISRDSLSPILRFYDHIILNWPKVVIFGLLVVVGFLGYHAKDFTLDASSETLLLEDDQDLIYLRKTTERYGSQDFVIVAYTPHQDLFSDPVLTRIAHLRDELKKLTQVSSVFSIIDAPLLESPPVPVRELSGLLPSLESPTVDKKLAKIELGNSPIYQNLLVSPDLKTTALIVNFKNDEVFQDLLSRRDRLRAISKNPGLTAAQADECQEVAGKLKTHRDQMRQQNNEDIAAIRAIMDRYRQDADLFLGGVAMITTDLIGFIKNDLKVFGLGIFIFLVVTLKIIFKRLQWILLPTACCTLSVIAMIGLLGLFGWEVTVISSNFVSLQLIITMSISIHLTVRYRGLRHDAPGTDHRQLVLDTVVSMFLPCLYAILTTIAGFGSLLLCNIKPVINFGWMMSAGVAVSFVITFLFFPAVLLIIGKGARETMPKKRFSPTPFLAQFTEAHGRLILVSAVIIFAGSLIGISRLIVENSFIDYFKETTEIYQGMKTIDQHLGGTTPLDVIVKMAPAAVPDSDTADPAESSTDASFDEFAEFDKPTKDERYWFTPDKTARIVRIHDYLDSLDETGKVLSLGTMLKVAEKINQGKPLSSLEMALLYTELPDHFKEMVFDPYVSIPNDEIRFSIRIIDSDKSLRRNALLKKIRYDLNHDLGLDPAEFRLTGLMVLYNNVLQSLFSSQIATLGVALSALMIMFLALFRSFKIALIAITPNMLAIGFVLGFMGWMKIPLDMMTITIAAISIGIAVDNTIHYIYRFINEFGTDKNYIATMHRCHGSIGYAMFYTSITIIIGFSILVLSNFIPSILFGLLTGLAMFIALVCALTLLPRLIVVFKPFGPEKTVSAE